MADAKKITMDELLASASDSVKKVVAGDTVSGVVLSVKKHEILIDLGAQGVGLVPRREASWWSFGRIRRNSWLLASITTFCRALPTRRFSR